MRVYCGEALVELVGADVEVAERVGAVPVARLRLDDLHVLCDGSVDAALLECFFRALERPFTVERRHSYGPQAMVSNSVAGLNERRCCGE